MDIQGLKEEYIGKELLVIIDVNVSDENVKSALIRITNDSSYDDIDAAKILLFENNKALVFVDFDCDGYRSGDWHLIHVRDLLDNNQTTGIKKVNSIVRDIEYVEDSVTNSIIITTDEYLIKMGQDNTDSYYPSNFFDVEECRDVALGIKEYEEVVLE